MARLLRCYAEGRIGKWEAVSLNLDIAVQGRPADVVGYAVTVATFATGEIEETLAKKSGRVRSGRAGAEARAQKLTPERRREIAKKAAKARWG